MQQNCPNAFTAWGNFWSFVVMPLSLAHFSGFLINCLCSFTQLPSPVDNQLLIPATVLSISSSASRSFVVRNLGTRNDPVGRSLTLSVIPNCKRALRMLGQPSAFLSKVLWTHLKNLAECTDTFILPTKSTDFLERASNFSMEAMTNLVGVILLCPLRTLSEQLVDSRTQQVPGGPPQRGDNCAVSDLVSFSLRHADSLTSASRGSFKPFLCFQCK